MTPEGRVKEAIKRRLRQRGIWFYMPVQNGMGVVGIPDFICCWGGRFLAIEAKAAGRKANVSANQERRLLEIERAGGTAVVVDDAAQLDELLSEVCHAAQ